jgi:hypothetical protein
MILPMRACAQPDQVDAPQLGSIKDLARGGERRKLGWDNRSSSYRDNLKPVDDHSRLILDDG